MYKRLLKVIFCHLFIILYWGLLYKLGLFVKEIPIINAISTILLISIYALIYTEISEKSINKKSSVLFTITSLLPFSFIMKENLGFKLRLALILISVISTFFYVRKYLNFEKLKYINILPISKKSSQIFTFLGIIFLFLVIYLFDINPLMINLFIQFVFLIFEAFFILFLKEKENTYEKTYKLYYLSDYMAYERNEFARIIHDDIIQDIFASKNYLSLKRPDTNKVIDILKKLEEKARNIMKLYQTNLFENASFETSIKSIFENIKSLYRDKEIKTEIEIDQRLIKELNKEKIQLISAVTKELINNIYKHSDATFIKYKLYKDLENIVISIESDGAGKDDLEKIKNSKRGLLLVRLMLNSNNGKISYNLHKDILKTDIRLEMNKNENSFIR